MKKLYLVRHAKSDWSHGALSDFDRPLNARGLKDAPKMGKHLKDVQGVVLEGVLCSTAKRAVQTAGHLLGALAYPLDDVVWSDEIYGGSAAELMGLIQGVDDQIASLMVIGHNPDMTDLVCHLSGMDMDQMPTCGVFALAFAVGSWQNLSQGGGTQLFFNFPKEI